MFVFISIVFHRRRRHRLLLLRFAIHFPSPNISPSRFFTPRYVQFIFVVRAKRLGKDIKSEKAFGVDRRLTEMLNYINTRKRLKRVPSCVDTADLMASSVVNSFCK